MNETSILNRKDLGRNRKFAETGLNVCNPKIRKSMWMVQERNWKKFFAEYFF